MRECAVVNASPLIYLSKIDRLPLLQLIAPRVLVPQAVMVEIATKGQGDVTYLAVLHRLRGLFRKRRLVCPHQCLHGTWGRVNRQ